MSDNILKLKDREVLDALCFMHSLAKENTRYETQEEAFQIVYEYIKELESRTGECDRDCKNCWKTKLVNQPKVGEWTPCSESLPQGCDDAEIEVVVSLYEPYSETVIRESGFALFYPENNMFRSVYGDRLDITDIVVAWMHLPPAYKGNRYD